MKIFDATTARLERSLDVRLVRHNVLAGNLANVDTPGYTPRDIDFAAAMSEAVGEGAASGPSLPMRETNARHIAVGGIAANGREIPIVETHGEAPSLDGNGVDLDRTMTAMAENGLQYGASARAVGKKLAIMRYVVSDGTA
jgi:flagellar basal-body rod protein FlgB